jgi:hypothetical protein
MKETKNRGQLVGNVQKHLKNLHLQKKRKEVFNFFLKEIAKKKWKKENKKVKEEGQVGSIKHNKKTSLCITVS